MNANEKLLKSVLIDVLIALNELKHIVSDMDNGGAQIIEACIKDAKEKLELLK